MWPQQIAPTYPRTVMPLIAVMLAIAGCSPSSEQSTAASSSESSLSTTKPISFDFPDLAVYTSTDPAQYDQVNKPRSQGFMFLAPAGLICASNAYPDNTYERVSCRGPLPHKGSGDWSVTAGKGLAGAVESITGDADFAQDKRKPPPLLPPMHKLTATKGDAVCAVDDKGMTACHVGDHGFILTPDKTTLF